MKLTYAVVFEQMPSNYGAYAPDVPGCVSVGDTWDEMLAMIREALTYHIEDLLAQGEPLPEPKRSIEEAIAYHSEALDEYDARDLAEYGDDPPTLSTRFEMVEIEVEVPAPRAARAG
jgi:predicted RNase H-like HicB family nuclease